MRNEIDGRFGRQIAFAPLGEEGQARLQRSRVLIVGCGALGGTVADLLVRAGTGMDGGVVALIDFDVVQFDNLHRQTLFNERHAIRSERKIDAAREVLLAANSLARIEIMDGRFDESNASMVHRYDLIIDATDDFSTRFVMNRAAVQYGKPLITAGVLGTSGQILTIFPGETACLECFLAPTPSVPPQESAPYGILPPTPLFFAAWESMEAIKVLSGSRSACIRNLISVDLWDNRTTQLAVQRDPDCPVCRSCQKTGFAV